MPLKTILQKIPSRSRKCCAGAEPICPGTSYASVLFNGDDSNYLRKDFCLSCWGQEEAKGARAYWQSKVPEKSECNEIMPQDMRALALLKRWLHEEPDEKKAEAFLLAMYLKRKRKLIQKERIEEQGHIFMLYEEAGSEEMLAVPMVNIDVLDASLIQKEVLDQIGDL